MIDHMAHLAQIVKADLEIQAVKEELDEIPIKVRQVENQLAIIDLEYQQKKSEVNKVESEIKKLKNELEQEIPHLKAKEERLNSIKTQKEYQAVIKEISSGKTLAKETEEKIAQRAASIETMNQTLAPLETQRQELLTELEKEKSEIQGNLDSLQAKLKELEAKLNEQLSSLPEDIKHKYRRIGEKRQPAAARIVDGTCQECFISLPPQLFIEIQKHKEIYSCPNCHRLLIIEVA